MTTLYYIIYISDSVNRYTTLERPRCLVDNNIIIHHSHISIKTRHFFSNCCSDIATSRSTFKFVADRLIRTTIEEGLNQLPYTECDVTTPTGCTYKGLKYQKGNCGVSIVRSGEAMEKALQDCCRSMRIGKILVDSDVETHEAKVIFAKFPTDIAVIYHSKH